MYLDKLDGKIDDPFFDPRLSNGGVSRTEFLGQPRNIT